MSNCYTVERQIVMQVLDIQHDNLVMDSDYNGRARKSMQYPLHAFSEVLDVLDTNTNYTISLGSSFKSKHGQPHAASRINIVLTL